MFDPDFKSAQPVEVAPGDEFEHEPQYHGLRMSADAFLAIPEDGFSYELVDGVVCMSPSATPLHQKIAFEIAMQFNLFLQTHPIGEAFLDVDVVVRKGSDGKDVVYQPDLVLVRPEKVAPDYSRLTGLPDVVVEVISTGRRRYDAETKHSDYERAGIGEYWLIDPYRKKFAFWRLEGGRYIEVAAEGERFASQSAPGFVLDVGRVRAIFPK